MDPIEQARYRIKNREFEDGVKQRRYSELMGALERLEEAEFKASHPDNPERVPQLGEIRRLKAEVATMIEEEFGIGESFREAMNRG